MMDSDLMSLGGSAASSDESESRWPPLKILQPVLIPVADLRKYVRGDHPEPIVADHRKSA